MASANQKRIQELEEELALKQRALENQFQMNRMLTVTLQEIAGDKVSPDWESLKAFAKHAIEITDAEAQMQQRDLNIAFQTISRLKFPTMLRKQWSGGEVQAWIDQYAEILRARAVAHYEDKLTKKETLQ